MSMDKLTKLCANPQDPREREEHFGRCPGCRIQKRLCFCADIPSLETKTKLCLLIHFKEVKRPSNSGLLATQCIPNSEVYTHGLPGAVTPKEPFDLEGYEPILLFPREDAKILTPEIVASWTKPVALIVPDGNWNQASRMPKRVEQLASVPTYILPPTTPTPYRLRNETHGPEGLATIEAIARTMAILGEEHVTEPMLKIFELFVMRTLWSKGALSTAKAREFLPV